MHQACLESKIQTLNAEFKDVFLIETLIEKCVYVVIVFNTFLSESMGRKSQKLFFVKFNMFLFHNI